MDLAVLSTPTRERLWRLGVNTEQYENMPFDILDEEHAMMHADLRQRISWQQLRGTGEYAED